ncbi:MAG: GIY-YIG nuclease family protein [Solirubrobacterales bacterium]
MDDQASPFDRAAEVEQLLAADETTLGRFWSYEEEGLSAQEMADREGTAGQGWVSNYRTLVHALRDGEVPTAPSVAAACARRIRSWLKNKELSTPLCDALTTQEALLTSRAEDRQAQDEEVEGALASTKQAESGNTPGIYVYTLPHYLRHPFDPGSGKTLLKVGHSSVDAVYRAEAQGRLTALPEDPILLRIYPADESRNAEREFHAWLRDADHSGGRSRLRGSEWFVTSTKFLDRIARSLGLDVQVVNDLEVIDD